MVKVNQNCKLIYLAVPSRLAKSKKDIEKQMDLVTKQGNAPLHPFIAFPYSRFEGGVVGKQKTWEFCCRLVDISDEFYLFGVSRGTVNELVYAKKKNKKITILVKNWDPNWRKYNKLLTRGLEFNDFTV